MEDFSAIFRQKLSNQAEVIARKSLERLQKDLQGEQDLTPQDIYYLAKTADIMLSVRDAYGKK